MEFIFELVFELFGELLLQLLVSVPFEMGLRSLHLQLKRQPGVWLSALGYAAMGAAGGALSLWLAPVLFMQTEVGRLSSLLLTPLGAGAMMAALGALRRRRNQPLVMMDRFSYGYLFALSMALVRYFFGR